MLTAVSPVRVRRWHRVTILAAAAIVTSSLVAGGTAGAADQPGANAKSFAKRVVIGAGRRMYVECRGTGSPTVLLLSGLDAAADLWHEAEQQPPTVYATVGKRTRVCAYDRPGTPLADGEPSRSDPVAQPTTPRDAVDDLHALLRAAHVPGPYVLAAHSYAGLIARTYAATYPREVVGMLLIDVLSPELRAQMTPTEWSTWKTANARPLDAIAQYPALERIDFDESLDQVEAAAAIEPMPLAVLSADKTFAQVVPELIDSGGLPPDTPRDFGAVVDRSNTIAQRQLAALVPGAVHVTDTRSGHNIMVDNAPIVTKWIRNVVDAVRNHKTALTS
jgi:pimeloyl-ACP methyl ester carboxylesterase